MNLELCISCAIFRAVSQYGLARRSAWLRRVARSRTRQARLRRLRLA